MAKAQGLSKHTMASTKSPTRRMIDFLSLLILAVVLSLTYINISPSTHIPSSLHPKSLSSHTTTTKTTSTTTSTSSKPIPFPFGQNNFSPNFSSPTTHHPPHQKRLNPQQLYDNYRCYGEKLWDMTQQVYRGEVPVPGRTFTSADLAGAWSRVDDPGHFVPVFEAWSRDTFGRVIGGGEVSAITTNQNKGYVSTSGTQEDATGARYEALYIPSAGTLVAVNIHSPLNLITRENAAMGMTSADAKTIVPVLNRWTDMAWYLWSDIFARSPSANASPRSLRYILHDIISNDDTRFTIEYVVARRNGGNLGLVYPGLEFGMETDEGKA
ncbi:MAG: hypothetical protein LQ350_005933, partial [Teloschistes chrysophthalmus]